VAAAHDRTLKLWDAATGRLLRSFGDRKHAQPNAAKEWPVGGTYVAFSPDGSHVLAGTTEGTMHLWQASTGEQLATLVGVRDGEWVVFTSEGFFEASTDGARLISIVRDLDRHPWTAPTRRFIGPTWCRKSSPATLEAR
jgi:WD40 repeat protein